MPVLVFEMLLPGAAVVILFLAVSLYRRIQCPSPLTWGRMLGKIGPMRLHHVLDYNKKLENEEEPGNWRVRREARRRHFKINWGYLSVQTKNTTALLQALRFEKLKIRASKPGLKYERLELAVVALIDEATDLRWLQVRWQFVLQIRHGVGLEIDKEIFEELVFQYKIFEEHMTALALAEGKWLHDMLTERLGLREWRVIEGGQSEPDPA